MPALTWQAALPPLLALSATVVTLATMAGQLRRARLIEDTPTSRIRSAAQGYVELSGFVLPNGVQPNGVLPNEGQLDEASAAAQLDEQAAAPVLSAPLTGKPCLWFRYTIERLERSRHGRRWRAVESGSSEQPLLLDDSTGRCLIDPRRAEVAVQRRERWSGDRRHPRRTTEGWVAKLLATGSYRYTEWRIEADDWLYVLGWFATPRQPGFAEQRLTRQKALLNRWKQDQPALVARFDSDGDGQIDLAEWEQARSAAWQQAEREVLAQPLVEPLPVISCGDRRRPFLLATKDPHQLARRYRRRALTALLVGVVITGTLTVRMVAGWH